MGKLFKDLKTGLEEAIAHTQGKIHLRSISFEMPAPPADYKPKDIKKMREQHHYYLLH